MGVFEVSDHDVGIIYRALKRAIHHGKGAKCDSLRGRAVKCASLRGGATKRTSSRQESKCVSLRGKGAKCASLRLMSLKLISLAILKIIPYYSS